MYLVSCCLLQFMQQKFSLSWCICCILTFSGPSCSSWVKRKRTMRGCKQFTWINNRKRVKWVDNLKRIGNYIYTGILVRHSRSRGESQIQWVTRAVRIPLRGSAIPLEKQKIRVSIAVLRLSPYPCISHTYSQLQTLSRNMREFR